MAQQTGPYRLYDNESIPYPRVRRGIIIVSFLLMIVWIAVVIFYAYKDPNIICGTNPAINMLTYIILGTSFVGIITYLASSDSRLKVKSWIRRIPMFWNSIIDSGYTSYFDPDYFEIKNGHYVRVQSNVYDADEIGLPKVDAVTPLNSFNMTIYRKYHQPVITKAKSWQIVNHDLAESLLRKFIIERTRIVLVGHSCLIVKAWSGEHLLIHKSKYKDFIKDQRATTLWPSLDTKLANGLNLQERYVEGLRYMTNKLSDPTTIIPVTVPANDPIRDHYDTLLTEMGALNSSLIGVDEALREVFDHMITDSQVPQSLKAVEYKYLELRMAALAKRINHQLIQSDILDKLKPDDLSDQTEYVLNSIRDNMISSNEYQLQITPDPRLVAAKNVLEKLALGPASDVNKALLGIVSIEEQYPVEIVILNRYATNKLKPHISAYHAGYKYLHSRVKSVLRKMNPKPVASKTIQSLLKTIKQAKLIEAMPVQHIAANNQKFMAIEVAKANVAAQELQTSSIQYQSISDTLKRMITNTVVSPDIKQIQAKHDKMKTEADRAAILIANQRDHLERKLQLDAELLQEYNKLKPQVSSLKETVIHQADQLVQLENKTEQTEQQLIQIKLKLAQATDERDKVSERMKDMSIDLKKAELATKRAEMDAMINELRSRNGLAEKNIEILSIRKELDGKLAAKQNEILTIQNELEAKQALIQNNMDLYEAATNMVRTLQEEVSQKENALNADKQLIEQINEQLASKTNELSSVTNECREKALQIAQMAQDLKTFEERNVEMAKNHELMLKTFQQEGDQKLKQITSAKDQEILAIKNEVELAKYALASAEAQKNDLAIMLQATQDAANKLNAQKTIATKSAMFLQHIKSKRMQQMNDDKYRELLQKFNDMNDQKTQLEVQVGLTKANLEQANNQIETLKEQVAAATEDQLSTTEERDSLITDLKQKQAAMEQSVNTMQTTISSHEQTIDQYKSELAAFEQKHNRELQEVDRTLAKEHAYAIRLEANLNDKLTQEQVQAKELQRLSEQLQLVKQKAEDDTQKLQEELSRSHAIHKKDISNMQESYNTNLDEFKQMCGKVVKQLSQYQSVIKLPLVFSPRNIEDSVPPHNLTDSQVIVELDLDMIDHMNYTLDRLLTNVKTKFDKSHLLYNIAISLYPMHCAKDTFLATVSGKIFEFIYTMYHVIRKHSGINRAIEGLKQCKDIPKDQYEIIQQCSLFIQRGRHLFAPHLDTNITFDPHSNVLMNTVYRLDLVRAMPMMINANANDADDDELYSTLRKQLDAYTYKYITNKSKSADTSQPLLRSQSDQMMDKTVDNDSDQRRATNSLPAPPRNPSVLDSTLRIPVNPIPELLTPVRPKGNPIKVSRA